MSTKKMFKGMDDFQQECRRRLIFWYAEQGGDVPTYEQTFVVWGCKTLQNMKCLVSTSMPDTIYAEYTYNGDDLGATVGNIINCSYKLMAQIKPDALLILGDTNSALSAISAKRLKVPICYI